ncbi:hypothetical protein SAMN07250955_101201 [Arboricoccus pini]|uniref:Uncharacterized protein n=1 Tax=Arboricoccus pini TaxID=1963835 RepID=A0A212PYU5_9PROT|nr:YeeE/YedE thiosulfate transporter family protein [Arboricoccus pini]SNB52183.1 hypothetical protein SAMN07250955_101201 [Arboricoccus pini]
MPLYLLAAPAIGIAYGLLAQRVHFCTMGALSDLFLFGSRRRLRGWVLAAATGLLLTQLLVAAGALAPGQTTYLALPAPGLPTALLGGCLLGYGMVLAGGCPSRNLVRLGGGSLKAGLVLLIMIVVALITTKIPLPMLLPLPALPADLGLPAGLILAIAGMSWSLGDRQLRSDRTALWVSFSLGLLVAAAWLGAPPGLEAGLNFAVATMAPSRPIAAFAFLLALGAVLGAHLGSRLQGRFRLEKLTGPDLRRMLGGAVLMGLALPLLGGCTIGMGLAGFSVLATPAILALLGMAAGARGGLFFLETGRLAPFPGRPS